MQGYLETQGFRDTGVCCYRDTGVLEMERFIEILGQILYREGLDNQIYRGLLRDGDCRGQILKGTGLNRDTGIRFLQIHHIGLNRDTGVEIQGLDTYRDRVEQRYRDQILRDKGLIRDAGDIDVQDRDTGVQRHKILDMQGFRLRDTRAQRCRVYIDTGVQPCTEAQRYRGLEIQGFKYTEVQRYKV